MNPIQAIGKLANSPLMKMMNMAQNGGNPQQLLGQFIQQNPQMKQALPFVQGKNSDQLKETFYNMCKERGVDPNAVAQSMGVNLPN